MTDQPHSKPPVPGRPGWTFNLLDTRPADADDAHAFQSMPILVDGTRYLCTPSHIVIALDAATGTEKWRCDPQADRQEMANIAASACHGVAYFRVPEPVAECRAGVFIPVVDGRTGAVDAESDRLCTGFGQQGYVDLNAGTGTASRATWRRPRRRS